MTDIRKLLESINKVEMLNEDTHTDADYDIRIKTDQEGSKYIILYGSGHPIATIDLDDWKRLNSEVESENADLNESSNQDIGTELLEDLLDRLDQELSFIESIPEDASVVSSIRELYDEYKDRLNELKSREGY